MNDAIRDAVGDPIAILGLVLFDLGARFVLTGADADRTIAAVEALALLFVGGGGAPR